MSREEALTKTRGKELGIEAYVAESGFKDGVFLGESPAEGRALANVGSDRYILFYL